MRPRFMFTQALGADPDHISARTSLVDLLTSELKQHVLLAVRNASPSTAPYSQNMIEAISLIYRKGVKSTP